MQLHSCVLFSEDSSSQFLSGQDPPKFSVVPGGVYRQEAGRELVIPCEAEGDPFPNITWRKVKPLAHHTSSLHVHSLSTESHV